MQHNATMNKFIIILNRIEYVFKMLFPLITSIFISFIISQWIFIGSYNGLYNNHMGDFVSVLIYLILGINSLKVGLMWKDTVRGEL